MILYEVHRREWPCDCGRSGTLKSYPPPERSALQSLTGLTGQTRDGLPVVQVMLLRRRSQPPWRGALGEALGEARYAAFVCPFGPEPGRVICHAWGEGTDSKNGGRHSHCKAPSAPAEYFLHAVDLDLPPRTIRGWTVRPRA